MRREQSQITFFIVLLIGSLLSAVVPAQEVTPLSPNAFGLTAIHQAARSGDPSLLSSLIQRGASVDARDELGRTPLIAAVESGRIECVKLLLASGADANARTRSGSTALIEAAARGSISIVRELVRAGADLNISQRGSGTALEVAERGGHHQIAAFLRNAGARSSGRSPGDKVCVRPWGADGYCGTVVSADKTTFLIRVTEIIGCKDGTCPAKGECSAGQPVGGAGGINVGDTVSTVSWCLTHTGVKP